MRVALAVGMGRFRYQRRYADRLASEARRGTAARVHSIAAANMVVGCIGAGACGIGFVQGALEIAAGRGVLPSDLWATAIIGGAVLVWGAAIVQLVVGAQILGGRQRDVARMHRLVGRATVASLVTSLPAFAGLYAAARMLPAVADSVDLRHALMPFALALVASVPLIVALGNVYAWRAHLRLAEGPIPDSAGI